MDNQNQIIIPTTPKDVSPIKDVAPINNDISSYTPITNASCDCKTIRILKSLLSGRFGEFTGMSTYLYQHFVINMLNSALANSLSQIAIQKLRHMELLGNAIISFGGNPRFTNGQGTPWSSRFINYTQNQQSFLQNNIRAEEMAIASYENAIGQVANESLKQLFREIIEDKRRHIQIFRSYLKI